MIITTAEKIEGKNITRTIGLVKGSTIRANDGFAIQVHQVCVCTPISDPEISFS